MVTYEIQCVNFVGDTEKDYEIILELILFSAVLWHVVCLEAIDILCKSGRK